MSTNTTQPDSTWNAQQFIFNEETRKAIEDARNGIGLTEGYHSAAELFAALDAEAEEE